ncbi:MAG TPA: hypothetical protein VKP30_02110, partial [Polyangiaceae bacterium]|nr:hypothetical protein [Polyangiaceae bacterium]
IRISTATLAERAVGFDLQSSSSLSDLAWEVKLDGKPWPKEAIYAGPLGIHAEQFERGINAQSDLSWLDSVSLPHIAAAEELGMFITRDPNSAAPVDSETSAEAQLEAQQAMQAWGYARKASIKKLP